MPIKIVVIGAGNALFSQGVISAIAIMPEMAGSTISNSVIAANGRLPL